MTDTHPGSSRPGIFGERTETSPPRLTGANGKLIERDSLAIGMGDLSSVNQHSWGKWSEPASVTRGSHYPLKRPHPSGRPIEARLTFCNGAQRDLHQVNGNGHHASSAKNRAHHSRTNNGERVNGTNGKGRSYLYKIFIAVIAVFFLIETLGQGVVFLLFRHTDLQAESLDIFPKDFWLEKVALDEDARFVPQIFMDRLRLSRGGATVAEMRNEKRFPLRPPRLALVLPNLARSPQSLYVFTIAQGLQVLGYKLEVLTLKDGELRSTWEGSGVSVKQLEVDMQNGASIDWLNYEGVITMSLKTKSALISLGQEPFCNVPVIWVVIDDAFAQHLGGNESTEAKELILDWRFSFARADVVIFPDYSLPMIYMTLDTGNFFVIPGSPLDVWRAEEYMLTHSRDSLRANYKLGPDHFLIVVVGSLYLYDGLWKEHALVMRALARALPSISDAPSRGVRLFVMGHANRSSNYSIALQVMAEHLRLEHGTVEYIGSGEDVTGILWMSDAVVYASFRDEQAFPPILTRAMCLQRPVIAPNRTTFRQHILDGESGLLFPIGDDIKLSEAIVKAHQKVKMSTMALVGQSKARDLLALNVTLTYGELLESILEFPVEVELPQPLTKATNILKCGWSWDALFPTTDPFQDYILSRMVGKVAYGDIDGSNIIGISEEQWMLQMSAPHKTPDPNDLAADWDYLTDSDLNEAMTIEVDLERDRLEEEELEERKAQVRSTWEDVTKMVRKTEVHKDDLKERNDEELERIGQPLCVYEPYHGKGAWPFLHKENTLYRGLSISTHGRRPRDDDVDAQERLPGLLNDSYYRKALCEFGAFFAIANHIDHVHRNAWIGFQPWRAASQNVALTAEAETALVEVVRTGKDGDALYFWAHTDRHAGRSHKGSPLNQLEGFWADCDSKNSGHCREAFAGSLRRMYGLPVDWEYLPPMPTDGGHWSASHCWAMPTSSFVEFVLFARMFVDALDSQHYEEHHDHGICCFVRFQHEGEHCYCRLLEGLINVWAYHSARRMFYLDPHTGTIEEQHPLDARKGKMWVKFFNLHMLKVMDEDLAEAADDGDQPSQRWLWPKTGEVYWQGMFERERRERLRLKQEKRQKQKEKLFRMKNRTRQKSLGKYVKPAPGIGYLPPLLQPIFVPESTIPNPLTM